MEISFGFLIVLILIIFPGLIYRKLYFYGEFSKEFNAGHNLVGLLAISSIPGLILLILSYFSFDYFFTRLDIGELIDKFKDINNPQFRFDKDYNICIKNLVNGKINPFIGFLYLSSILLGLFLGRIVRISRLDTKFKLLRFKNSWFYLFNGQQTDFKKLKHLKKRNKRHLFTKADILIESSGKSKLYSGIVVDYELQKDDCSTLSKVMLQNAERYNLKNEKVVPVEIPGTLFVVDCSSIININLTYIYEETGSILKSKIPNTVETVFGLMIIFLIPIFIFRSDSIDWLFYKAYFNLNWYEKLLSYFIAIQLLSLLNPFIKREEEYKFIRFKEVVVKVIMVLVLGIILYLIT